MSAVACREDLSQDACDHAERVQDALMDIKSLCDVLMSTCGAAPNSESATVQIPVHSLANMVGMLYTRSKTGLEHLLPVMDAVYARAPSAPREAYLQQPGG